MSSNDSEFRRAVNRAVGDEVRIARIAARLDRRTVAGALRDADLGVRSIQLYENGERSMTVPRLVDVCNVVGVSAPDLLCRALATTDLDLNVGRGVAARITAAVIGALRATDLSELTRDVESDRRTDVQDGTDVTTA